MRLSWLRDRTKLRGQLPSPWCTFGMLPTGTHAPIGRLESKDPDPRLGLPGPLSSCSINLALSMARNSDVASSTHNSKDTLGESNSSRDLRPQALRVWPSEAFGNVPTHFPS